MKINQLNKNNKILKITLTIFLIILGGIGCHSLIIIIQTDVYYSTESLSKLESDKITEITMITRKFDEPDIMDRLITGGYKYVNQVGSARIFEKNKQSYVLNERIKYRYFIKCTFKKCLSDIKLGTYILKNSKLMVSPYVQLGVDNEFEFFFSVLSSNLCSGEYKVDNNKLILTEDDKHIYVFEVRDDKLMFLEEESTKLPKYPREEKVVDGDIFEYIEW